MWMLAAILAGVTRVGEGSTGASAAADMSRYELVSPNYNRQLRPNEGGDTDVVQIGMFVNSVRTISENDMTVILDVFLQAEWFDQRLNWTWNTFYSDYIRYNMPPRCIEHDCSADLQEMTLGKDFAADIWRPDFYLPDAIHIVPADDYNDNVCVRLRPDMTMFYSNRLIITISCIMKLVFFPFDKHVCPICVGSYKYKDSLLRMVWSNELSGMYPEQFTANFIMEGYTNYSDYYNISEPYLNDMFTIHCFNITIHRKYNIFLVTLYLPSVSLVALSWVNFWIDHKAIPARAGLSITAILAQITLIVGMASRFPSVSDLKMADLYLTVNFIYTFATLIEFAIVSYNPEEKRRRQSAAAHAAQAAAAVPPPTPATCQTPLYTAMSMKDEDIVVNREVLRNGSVSVPVSATGSVSRSGSTQREYIRLRRLDGGPEGEYKAAPPTTPSLRPFRPPRRKRLNTQHTDLDDVSKWVFPITFIVWNCIFFTVNLVLAEKECIILGSLGFDYCKEKVV